MNKVYAKAFASIESVEEKDYGPNGGFTAILSTPSQDRDGDKLMREEWKEFTSERYPLDMDHGMSVAETVGSFTPYFDGEKMMMDAYFSSIARAQEVRTLVDEGHIRTVSVAFMTDKSKKDGTPKRELLNAGIVAIPSNRDAVILASKAAHDLKDALSEYPEGEVPAEVVEAVSKALGIPADEVDKKSELTSADVKAPKGIYVDVIPRLNEDALKNVLEAVVKATATASGIGAESALVQAIHDASSHLGAGCPVVEVEVESETTDPGSGADDGANKELDQEAFTKALDETLTPEESPADESPAPDVKSAAADENAADAEAVKKARERELLAMIAHTKSV